MNNGTDRGVVKGRDNEREKKEGMQSKQQQ